MTRQEVVKKELLLVLDKRKYPIHLTKYLDYDFLHKEQLEVYIIKRKSYSFTTSIPFSITLSYQEAKRNVLDYLDKYPPEVIAEYVDKTEDFDELKPYRVNIVLNYEDAKKLLKVIAMTHKYHSETVRLLATKKVVISPNSKGDKEKEKRKMP